MLLLDIKKAYDTVIDGSLSKSQQRGVSVSLLLFADIVLMRAVLKTCRTCFEQWINTVDVIGLSSTQRRATL